MTRSSTVSLLCLIATAIALVVFAGAAEANAVGNYGGVSQLTHPAGQYHEWRSSLQRRLDGDDEEEGEHHGEEEEGEHGEGEHHDDESDPWGEVIVSSIIVNFVTLTGVLFLVPVVASAARTESFWAGVKGLLRNQPLGGGTLTDEQKRRKMMFDIVMTSFACGAILAAAVFLIIPEALLLIGESDAEHEDHDEDEVDAEEEGEHDDEHGEHGDENGVAWKFGAAVLGGFLLPVFLSALFPRATEHSCDDECVPGPSGESLSDAESTCSDCEQQENLVGDKDVETPTNTVDQDGDNDVHVAVPAPEGPADTDKPASSGGSDHTHTHVHLKQESRPINWRLCSSVLIGDFFHNFADGIFIGTAWLLCSRDIAITIVATTIYHEIAQEIADFFLLTNHGGLAPLYALGVNFLSGLSVMLGGIVVLAANPSSLSVGVILSVSAGVYIHLAASESMPRVSDLLVSRTQRLISLLAFAIGAVPIGLVLLNHSHCDGDHE